MKNKLILLFFVLQTALYAQTPTSPNLEFVCELKVTTSERLVVGETQHGIRRIIPITGGTFEGLNFKGTILSGGADYQYANKENVRQKQVNPTPRKWKAGKYTSLHCVQNVRHLA